MKILSKCLGGSHAYGLNTPTSDTDIRGVFANEKISQIIGLDRYEHQDLRAGDTDEFYFELRHYLASLRKTNTQALELLFNEDWLELSNEFKLIQSYKHELIDSDLLYKSLRGYILGERRLANGERTGKLGGKRFAQLQKYGFSPKNFTQLFRLAWAGKIFFEEGIFPVNVRSRDEKFAKQLIEIKTEPAKYSKDQLNIACDAAEQRLETAFNKRTHTYRFNQNLAHELCLHIYYPVLKNHKSVYFEQLAV